MQSLDRGRFWSDSLRREGIEAALRKLGELTPRQRKVMEAMTTRIASRLLSAQAPYARPNHHPRSRRERLGMLGRIFFVEGEE